MNSIAILSRQMKRYPRSRLEIEIDTDKVRVTYTTFKVPLLTQCTDLSSSDLLQL